MASDKQQFRDAARRRVELREAGMLGAPDEPGTTVAILVPYIDHAQPAPQDSYSTFEAESRELAARARERGRVPDVRFPATVEDFRDVLSDPRVSEVVVSGMGNFSAVTVTPPGAADLAALPSGRTDGMLGWYDLTMLAERLPQGRFTSRICGRLNRTLNVPLGFVCADHRNIYSPVGDSIYPDSLEHPDNGKIRQVTDTVDLEYRDVKELFPRQAQRSGPVIDLVPRSAYFVLADTVHSLQSRLDPGRTAS